MDIATSKWFRFLNENKTMITEGLDDIGLPQYVIEYINDAMPESPEKSKVLIGNLWKSSELSTGRKDVYRTKLLEIIMRGKPPYLGGLDSDPDNQTPEAQKLRKIVKFVLENLTQTVTENEYGTWSKAFRKAVRALGKAGAPPEKIEEIKAGLDNFLKAAWHNWWSTFGEIGSFLNDDPTNYELAKEAYTTETKQFDLYELQAIATMYFENKEDPDDIVHRFADGSYWYNLNTSNCPVEAERMGHCGTDSRGTLYSLRKKKKGRRDSSSYITMTVSSEIIYQIKGRNNDAPPEETWDHIVWFIDEFGIERVEETGEHSNDSEGLQEMNEYLKSKTNAKFAGNIEERIEKVNEAISDIDMSFSAGIEEAIGGALAEISIYCAAEDSEEFGGLTGQVYLSYGAGVELNIELGWSGVVVDSGMYRATVGSDTEDQTVDDRYEGIPTASWGSDARDFEKEILSAAEEPPSSGDIETEWSVEPDGDKIVLIIKYRTSTIETQDEDDDAYLYSQFADEMLSYAGDASEAISDIRTALSEGGYSKKTQFDLDSESFEERIATLESWAVGEATGRGRKGVTLDWIGPEADIYNSNPVPDENLRNLPMDYQMYSSRGLASGREDIPDPIFTLSDLFDSAGKTDRQTYRASAISSPVLNNVFNSFLAESVVASLNPKSQLSLDFGPNYEAKAAKAILAKDGRFAIVPQKGNRYATKYHSITIMWSYRMTVDEESPEKEFEVVGDIAELLNANPGLINSAVIKTVQHYRNIHDKEIADNRATVTSSENLIDLANKIIDRYGDSAPVASTWAPSLTAMAKWMLANIPKMNNIEKYIAYSSYLNTLANGERERAHQVSIEMDDPQNIGKPKSWNDQVERQEMIMGSVKPVLPESRDRAIESQVERVDRLLKEYDASYDLRLYNVQVGCTVDKNVGGTESETATEIRGIPGVTTVRPVAAKKRDMTPTSEFVLYDIKFEIVGSKSRVEYRDEVLMPSLRKIRGLSIVSMTPLRRTNQQGSIRTVRESKILKEYGMGSAYGYTANGGGTSNLGKQRHTHGREMPTPRPQLQSILDDWSQNGEQAYDAPTNYTDMRYHVMMPVEELLPFTTSEYSGEKKDWQSKYQHFISTGGDVPVYLALGQNGKVKITGGEDQVWFAKESGLEELPVFLSYQKQV
jgi:hypothetical protein